MPSLGEDARDRAPANGLGELQAQLMGALWRLGGGTVEDVRRALPLRYEGAYTTVQTVLNRLAQRGLLIRERRGQTIRYRPTITEADYVEGIIERTLAGASHDARRTVLVHLVRKLDERGLSEVRSLGD